MSFRTSLTTLTLLTTMPVACADDRGTDDTEGSAGEPSTGIASDSTVGEPTTGSTTDALPALQVVVPAGYTLCSGTWSQALEEKQLFRTKARVTIGAGSYDVSDATAPGEDIVAPFTIPLGIEHQLDLAGPRSYMITGEEAKMQRAEDMTIAPHWSLTSAAGYHVVRVFQYFSTIDPTPPAWTPSGRTSLGLAVSAPSDVETLALDTADAVAFNLWAGFGGVMVPCEGRGTGTRADTIVVEGGALTFDLRREFPQTGSMLRATGELDGRAIDESDFWNLEYGVTSADGEFDGLPFYAVRFPETPDGECGLWIGWVAEEERAAAFYLDCSLQTITREVAILSTEQGEWLSP